jgi:hypothetical protein
MTVVAVKFIDRSRRVVAAGTVAECAGLFRGDIDLTSMPPSLRQTFAQYEEIVNNQTFSLLDEIEDQVHRIGIRVDFGAHTESAVEDLQVYPSTGRVSFRLPRQEMPSAAQDQAAKFAIHDDRRVP